MNPSGSPAGTGNQLTLVLSRPGRRLDALLAELLQDRGFSRSAIRRWMEEGRVLCNGRPAKPSGEARPGDEVSIAVPAPPPSRPFPRELPFGVAYEDEACLVVDKPSGLVTHPSKGHWDDSLVNALLATERPLSGGSAPDRPGILHRLDKDTSGLLVVAKSDAAHAFIARQFSERTVTKVYLAVVWGRFPQGAREVDAPIGRDPRHRTRMAVTREGRPALTTFSALDSSRLASLVEARPRTGRTHQIRVHLAHIKHPVVGDHTYGGRPERGLPPPLRGAVEGLGRFLLHAHRLCFHSPAGPSVDAVSPPPSEFLALLEEFKRHG